MAQQLEYAVRTGQPLLNVSGNIKKLQRENWDKKQHRREDKKYFKEKFDESD